MVRSREGWSAPRRVVYVLNAGGSGSVQGYRIAGKRLQPINDSNRSLGLAPITGPTQFLNTPGQVGFTPDGDQLIVTTKANGSHIDVFQVQPNGRLSNAPVVNNSATPVPFGFVFDARGRLVVGEAATSDVSTYVVDGSGTVTAIGSATDSQAALCWIDKDRQTYFVSNAGSDSVSSFRLDAGGHPSLVATTGVGAGTIDLDHSGDGRFLYVELGGSGSLGELSVDSAGHFVDDRHGSNVGNARRHRRALARCSGPTARCERAVGPQIVRVSARRGC